MTSWPSSPRKWRGTSRVGSRPHTAARSRPCRIATLQIGWRRCRCFARLPRHGTNMSGMTCRHRSSSVHRQRFVSPMCRGCSASRPRGWPCRATAATGRRDFSPGCQCGCRCAWPRGGAWRAGKTTLARVETGGLPSGAIRRYARNWYLSRRTDRCSSQSNSTTTDSCGLFFTASLGGHITLRPPPISSVGGGSRSLSYQIASR